MGSRNWCIGAVAVLAAFLSSVSASAQTPIPSVNVPPAPTYLGQPATPQPVRGVGRIPRNHFMAANGDFEIHDDGWQSDIYTRGGPLGRAAQTFSSYLAVSGLRRSGATAARSRSTVAAA